MQGYDIQKSSTAYPLVFLMVLSSDHITGATGLSPTVTISKNGGAFAAPSGAVAEIANGWYKCAGNATDTNTLGPLLLHATAATADPSDSCYPVVAYNPQDAVHLGLTALPNTACTTNASLITSGTGTDQISVSAGKVSANVTQWASNAVAATNVNGVPVVDVGYFAGAPTVNGTAQAGAATSITLANTEPATDGYYQWQTVGIVAGTGVGQSRLISGYVGATKVASVDRAWAVTPDNTSQYVLGATTDVSSALIATAVWTDTTSGDFTTVNSPGKVLVAQLGGAFTTTSSSVYSTASLANAPTSGTAPTAAQIATAVWTDTTAGDFTANGSPGKVVVAQLGGAFTTTSSSVYSTASLANAPAGGTPPTVSQIATAVWQDATAGDFTAAGSIGKALFVNAIPGAAGGHFIAGSNAATTVNITGNLSGSVGSVTGLTTATIATAVWTDTTSGDFATLSSPGKILVAQLGGAFSTTSSSIYSTASLVNAPTGGSAPTAAQIATAVWTDTTSGDFATLSSPGKILVSQLGGAFSTTSSSIYSTASLANAPTGSAPTAAQIATAVWTDTTSGDFATLGSPGKILVSQLGNAFTTTSSSIYSTASLANAPTSGSAPTAAQIATAVWTDTTAGDFTTVNSPGKILVAQLGGAFTTATSSIYSTASLANAPTGGSAPTAAQIATAVWTDTTAGDFTVNDSPGKVVVAQLGGAFTTASSSVYSTTSLANAPTGGPTAAQIATAVWTDTTSSDFTSDSSPGKILVSQLGGAFTDTSSSIYSTASLANAPTGGSAPTAAQIATAVWTDTTAGDFTTVNSPGKILVAQLGGAFTTATSSIYSTASLVNAPTGGSAPTAAQIATAVWTDTTASDFTATGSPGKVVVAQLGGAFTTASSSVYTTESLVNAPTGGSAPTVSQIATAVWQDATAGDFTAAGSIGKALFVNAIPGAAGGHFIAGTNATTAVTLTGAGLDAVVVEAGLNARQALSIIAAATAGVGGTATNTYAGAGVVTNRITYTASAGTRTVVNLSPPA